MTTAPVTALPATPVTLSTPRFLTAWSILLGGMVGWWLLRPFFDAATWTNLFLAILFTTSKIATLLCLSPAKRRMPWSNSVAYWLWPGMRPRCFLPGYVPDPTAPVPTVRAFVVNLLTAIAFLWLLPLVLPVGTPLVVRLWIGLVGYAFLVMFALMDAYSLVYRRLGFPVEKLWWAPIVSRSLGEFWGQRWNRIFSGMLREVLFLPLVRRVGIVAAVFIVFLYSGLLHETVSVGAGSGYGGPTLYFLLQFAGMILERSQALRPWLRIPALGWAWTLLVVLAPAGFLVHGGYLAEGIRPSLESLGVPGLG